MVAKDNYGPSFKRARMDAAQRLGVEFSDRAHAAKAIGISDAYLKKLENGEKRPSFEALESMAAAYGVMVGDLLPSQAPRGREVDSILAPLATLPAATRARFVTQMSAFARLISAEINEARPTERPAIVAHERGDDAAFPVR